MALQGIQLSPVIARSDATKQSRGRSLGARRPWIATAA